MSPFSLCGVFTNTNGISLIPTYDVSRGMTLRQGVPESPGEEK